MRYFIAFLFFIQMASAMDVQITYIERGSEKTLPLIFLSNGKVAKIYPYEFKEFEQLHKQGAWLRITLDAERRVLAFQLLPSSFSKFNYIKKSLSEWKPSVISDLKVANKIFKTGRYVNKESQCYNRAHVWSFEWHQRFGLNSEKTFIFFTRKYIRKFDFEWWFHVAPSVQVIEDGFVRQRIMDVKYARAPLRTRNWTDIFMRNDANCPIINTYTDYANFPETGFCYVMTVPMYYYQPVDIENMENHEVIRENWMDVEISQAYLEAMNEIWP